MKISKKDIGILKDTGMVFKDTGTSNLKYFILILFVGVLVSWTLYLFKIDLEIGLFELMVAVIIYKILDYIYRMRKLEKVVENLLALNELEEIE